MGPSDESWELYGSLAPLYDAFYRTMDYRGQADLYARLHRELSPVGGRRLLDLCCGTGRHAARLSERGYRAVGYDQSRAMLRAAARRLAAVVRGDHRKIALRGPFDLVTCVGHSLLQVQTPVSLRETLAQIFALLAPGGVFLCDMIDRRAGLDSREHENFDEELGPRYGIQWLWDGSSESITTVVRMGIHQGGEEMQAEDRHRLLALEVSQLVRELETVGFDVHTYEDDVIEDDAESDAESDAQSDPAPVPLDPDSRHALLACVRPA